MRVATDIASWAVEARKHGMSYGQYVQAVEHGELPPPKARKKLREEKVMRKCIKCGEEFAVTRRICDGYLSQAKYCGNCRFNAQHGFVRGGDY